MSQVVTISKLKVAKRDRLLPISKTENDANFMLRVFDYYKFNKTTCLFHVVTRSVAAKIEYCQFLIIDADFQFYMISLAM